jgi:hypothetical protein
MISLEIQNTDYLLSEIIRVSQYFEWGTHSMQEVLLLISATCNPVLNADNVRVMVQKSLFAILLQKA